ncbi:hypothetical protein [Thalassobacillus sp. C254]|uniref:hypothetical protein n=1 Tax=Thalassobacillus sp. C254 TaxID=1225341 RepID=UPI0022B62EAA|nr:hypothetical protein [Thalassobacillus sp. C254]
MVKSFIDKLKLGTKLNVLIVAILLCFSTVIGFVVQGQITNGIERTAVEKAQSDLALGYSYIDAQYRVRGRLRMASSLKVTLKFPIISTWLTKLGK